MTDHKKTEGDEDRAMTQTRGRQRGASSLVTIAATVLLTLAIAAGAAW